MSFYNFFFIFKKKRDRSNDHSVATQVDPIFDKAPTRITKLLTVLGSKEKKNNIFTLFFSCFPLGTHLDNYKRKKNSVLELLQTCCNNTRKLQKKKKFEIHVDANTYLALRVIVAQL